MIAIVHGTLLEKGSDHVIVDTGGIGYRIFIPQRTLDSIGEPGTPVRFRTQLVVREDAWMLFGFLTRDEVALYRLLDGVNGIGPRTALAILSLYEPGEIVQGLLLGDEKLFTKVSGIGKRTAARLILEAKDKVAQLGIAPGKGGRPGPVVPVPASGQATDEARVALAAMGMDEDEVEAAMAHAASELGEAARTQDLVRGALAWLRRAR